MVAENVVINCPFCDKGLIDALVVRGTYVVDNYCPHCNVSSSKIERNMNLKRTKLFSVEGQFLKKERG